MGSIGLHRALKQHSDSGSVNVSSMTIIVQVQVQLAEVLIDHTTVGTESITNLLKDCVLGYNGWSRNT